MALPGVARWIVVGSVFAAGCAPLSQAAVNGKPAVALPQDAGSVLQHGFGAIVERHIEPVSVATVAFSGIEGFKKIDPRFAIAREGDQLVATVSETVVGRHWAPADNDTAGWSNLTLAIASEARTASDRLAAASTEGLYEAVFDTALASLDRFSRYATAEEARDHRASRNGFGGVGIVYEPAGEALQISSVVTDGPAARAQLQVGDRLTHIDGTSVAGLDKKEVARRLRGAVASEVKLTILRPGATEPVTVAVRRSLVVPPTASMKLTDGVAVIRVTGFNQRTAAGVAERIRQARDEAGAGLKGVVLDLRGNPGGLLDQAVAIADQFMSAGKIVTTRGRHRSASQSYDAVPGDLAEDLPAVVIVDAKSASASEILAAALQDAGRAVVIGTNSYGKGTVQTVVRMPNDGEMTLTWSRFYSPSGYAIHGLGVLPTICTSSRDKEGNTPAISAAVFADPAPYGVQLAAWRSLPIEEREARQNLRKTCPSELRTEAGLEVEVARRLLADPALYERNVTAGRGPAGVQRAAHRAG